MPTPRAYSFLVAAFIIYLFANQTQVGWLYVMAALLAGTMLAAGWLSRGTLRGLTGSRLIPQNELHEGDEATVYLKLSKRGGAAQICLTEHCPLVAPDNSYRNLKMFIPSLPSGEAVEFDYTVTLDRRGLHKFPDLELSSQAPFGFFRRRRTLPITTRVLVYPEVRSLQRLDLLDRQLTPEMPRPRPGVGYEVIGVRPFRAGDSPRHIHWRSVARTGELISKEFADEVQPGLSLVLDLYHHPYAPSESKHVPFEWAVKVAASIGDYAYKHGYPLHLVADGEALAPPMGTVAWPSLLQYLARVQATGTRPLASVMGNHPTQAFVAVVLPWPDATIVETLVSLARRRVQVMAAVLDPETFPDGGLTGQGLAGQLMAAGIEVHLIRYGEDWTNQLVERTAFEHSS
jgi:uncharacterized protein (DUF58 family)